MSAYYNELNPKKATWLRELIAMGAIAHGEVDERDIKDVTPDELVSYTQCHFFAGIGGWSLALRGAGWPDDCPIWTGSLPCQPFSTAGKRAGASDERDLWWAMFWLIQQCRPATIIGEQVSSKDGLGWWDTVASDLEREDYAATAFDLCAAGVGAFHVRQRLYWVANANGAGSMSRSPQPEERKCNPVPAGTSADSCPLGNAKGFGSQGRTSENPTGEDGGEPRGGSPFSSRSFLPASSTMGQGLSIARQAPQDAAQAPAGLELECERSSSPHTFWNDAIWIPCSDGKARPTKSGVAPVVNGVSPDLVHGSNIGIPQTENTAEARTLRIHGYGDAIVVPLATEFVSVCMEVLKEQKPWK